MPAQPKSRYTGVTPETRRRMQAVRRHNTTPEMLVRQILHAHGYRYRLHRKNLPGTPDIVFPSRHKIILVHGCFWHGHANCKRGKLPSSNLQIWKSKIDDNRARDERNISKLHVLGWDVLVVWECELNNPTMVLSRLRQFLETI